MSFEQTPGWLGFTSAGVVAIHADWPAYPLEHGVPTLLRSFACFPEGTIFDVCDNIDRCLLLAPAEGEGSARLEINDKRMCISVWQDDLLNAADAGFVSGVERISEFEYEDRRLNEIRSDLMQSLSKDTLDNLGERDPLDLLGVVIDGNFVPSNLRERHEERFKQDDEEDDWWEEFKNFPGFLQAGLSLTPSDWNRVGEFWTKEAVLTALREERVRLLLAHEYYDTALRELCVILEVAMKQRLGS